MYRILRSAKYFLHLDDTFSLEDIERRMGWIGGFYGGRPVWFEIYFKLSELDPSNPRDDPSAYFDRVGGGAPARLNTRVAILAYRDVAPRIAALFNHIDLQQTRMMRQDGGLIQAPTATDGIIPQQGEIYTDKRTGELLVDPAVAVSNRIVGVYDIAAYHDVEAFYFRHSTNEITGFTLDYLWPSMKVDDLYRRIAQTAKQHAKEYLSQHASDVADPVYGVLDPGYVVPEGHRPDEGFLSRVRRWFVSTGGG